MAADSGPFRLRSLMPLPASCRQWVPRGPTAVASGVRARLASEDQPDRAPSPWLRCALSLAVRGRSVGTRRSGEGAATPRHLESLQNLGSGEVSVIAPLWGDWLVKLFRVRSTRKAGLRGRLMTDPQPVPPDMCRFLCVHRARDDSGILRLLGPSSQCPHLGNMQLVFSPPPRRERERETALRSLGGGVYPQEGVAGLPGGPA